MLFKEYQKVFSFVLVFAIVFSLVFLPPKKAVAQGGLAGCLVSGIASLIMSMAGVEVPVKDYGQSLKDQCIDGLFYVLNEMVLKQITADTVNWINSGFDGNPAFVEDYDKLLTNVADAEFGAFLESSELSFLCSPFQLEIKKALIRQNKRGSGGAFEKNISCRLSEVSDNIENFLEGDFTDGGWEAWRTLAEDNPYSNYMKVSLELKYRQLGKVETKTREVEIGRGFLSYQNCACPEGFGDDGFGGCVSSGVDAARAEKSCSIETPGSVIENQLNNVLPSGLRRLEAADEINEIVDALIAHYVNEVFTKGLKSLSKKDSSGKSYNDQVKNSATTTPPRYDQN